VSLAVLQRGALACALGIEGGLSSFERVQFGRGNDELCEPTVQADQNTLANVDGGNIHSLCVGEAGGQLPFKLLHVFGLARSTRHFPPQPMAAQNGRFTPRNAI